MNEIMIWHAKIEYCSKKESALYYIGGCHKRIATWPFDITKERGIFETETTL